jgi:hypothetical protein
MYFRSTTDTHLYGVTAGITNFSEILYPFVPHEFVSCTWDIAKMQTRKSFKSIFKEVQNKFLSPSILTWEEDECHGKLEAEKT